MNRVDRFIVFKGELYPLKYTYSLAIDTPPITYTTDQMKYAMKHLALSFHSLKAEREETEKFEKRVRRSQQDPEARANRLQKADTQPRVRYVTNISFAQNPDVVAEVLERAKGKCESCGCSAPFVRASDQTPYLEVHHIIMLADNGPDSADNAEALCPNCHRRKHFG